MAGTGGKGMDGQPDRQADGQTLDTGRPLCPPTARTEQRPLTMGLFLFWGVFFLFFFSFSTLRQIFSYERYINIYKK